MRCIDYKHDKRYEMRKKQTRFLMTPIKHTLSIRAVNKAYCVIVFQYTTTGHLVSSETKTGHHNIKTLVE